MAVVVAGELHHRGPAGEAPGGADGRHRRLGAARHQAHHLARRDAGADLLGQQHLALGRGAVAGAVDRGPLHGLDDGRVGVAGDDGAVRLHEVDVAGALGVPHVGALGPGDEVGRAPDGPEGAHGAVDAPGDHALGAGEQLVVGRHGPEDRDTRRGHGHPRRRPPDRSLRLRRKVPAWGNEGHAHDTAPARPADTPSGREDARPHRAGRRARRRRRGLHPAGRPRRRPRPGQLQRAHLQRRRAAPGDLDREPARAHPAHQPAAQRVRRRADAGGLRLVDAGRRPARLRPLPRAPAGPGHPRVPLGAAPRPRGGRASTPRPAACSSATATACCPACRSPGNTRVPVDRLLRRRRHERRRRRRLPGHEGLRHGHHDAAERRATSTSTRSTPRPAAPPRTSACRPTTTTSSPTSSPPPAPGGPSSSAATPTCTPTARHPDAEGERRHRDLAGASSPRTGLTDACTADRVPRHRLDRQDRLPQRRGRPPHGHQPRRCRARGSAPPTATTSATTRRSWSSSAGPPPTGSTPPPRAAPRLSGGGRRRRGRRR